MKRGLLFLLITILFPFVQAATFIVTNNNDSGAGSLRQAIIDANNNAGIDNISFAIPSATQAGRTINLSSSLPTIDEGVVIDGTTQNTGAAFGVSDAYIAINGGGSGYAYCFELEAQNIEIYGMYIYGFSIGIRSWFGSPRGNNTIGAPGKGNVISGNTDGIFMYSGDNTTIQSNFIGLNPDGVTSQGNADDGIFIYLGGTETITIGGATAAEGNVVSGNGAYGIACREAQYTVSNNKVGTDYTGNVNIGNGTQGIRISLDTDNSLISNNKVIGSGTYGINAGGASSTYGRGNEVAHSGSYGIIVFDDNNLISENSFYANTTDGIRLNNGNINKAAPIITNNDATEIRGTAAANDIIEIFSRDNVAGNCEGMTHLVTVNANGSGDWFHNGNYSGCGSFVVTGTDAANNTSEFNDCPTTPAAPTYSGPTTFCGGTVGDLMVSGESGAIFNWYTGVGLLRTLIHTGNPYSGMSASGTLYVTQTVGGCTSSELQIDITVTPATTGANCANAHAVTTLPFNQTGLTTCSSCDDYDDNSAGVSCTVGDYMDDEDYVFSYIPSVSEMINVNVSNTSNWSGVFVFDGCPDVGTTNCIASQTEILGDPMIDGINVTAGTTYYIVVASDDYVGCTGFDIAITTCNSAGTSCSTAESISSLPYATSSTTCGFCNFYDNTDACGSSYMNGEEHVYTYTPSANEDIVITMANVPTQSGVFLLDGCPDAVGTNCIASTTTDAVYDDGLLKASVTAGTTYYVVVSSTSGNCSDYDMSIFIDPPTPPCLGTSVQAGDSACTAKAFCGLESFCGNTSATYTDNDVVGTNLEDAGMFCGSIDNSSWVSFVADATTATLVIEVGNCSGASGIQAMIFETSDCINYTKKSNCWSPGVIETGYITATNLVQNQVYYLMVDGYGGEVCDYAVSVATGNQDPVVATDTSICIGGSATLIAAGGDGVTYDWDNGASGSSIVVSPSTTTEFIVVNTTANPICDQRDTATVTVLDKPRATIADASICSGAAASMDVNFIGNNPWSFTYSDGNGTNSYTQTGITTSPYTINVAIGGQVEITQVVDSVCTNDTSITANVTSNSMDDPGFTYANFCESDSGNAVVTGLVGGAFSFNVDPADGSGINPSTGMINNGVPGSTYAVKYVTNGACPDSQVVSVGVGTLPDPGTDTSIAFCNNEGSIDLFSQLGATPLLGGQWKDNNTLNQPNGVINTLQGSSLNGNHTYTMVGDSGCTDSIATISLTITDSAFAGNDTAIILCSDTTVGLMTFLHTNAQVGGTWYRPDAVAMVSTSIQADTAQTGNYYYVVNGTGGCGNDTAFLNVTINTAADAGLHIDTTLCNNAGIVDLNTYLYGTPQNTGTWNYPHTVANENGSLDLNLAVSGSYLYTVTGPVGCPDDTASVTLVVSSAVNAGSDNTVTICSDSTISLDAYLSGHDIGGVWYAPNGLEVLSDSIQADTAASGNYIYVLSASNPCVNDTATLAVTINMAPNAGEGLDTIVCSNYGIVNTFTFLKNSPDNTGDWTYPSGAVNQNGVFNVATETEGSFLYTVAGPAGCVADSATIRLTITDSVNAGVGGSYSLCSDSTIDLFDFVTGEDLGGTWFNPSNVALGSSSVNLATATSGDYLYIVSAGDSCLNDTATVNLSIATAVTAGTDVDSSLCSSYGALDLTTFLIDEDAGGHFIYPGIAGNQNGQFDASSASAVTGTYLYIVPGGAGCQTDTSELDLTFEQAVNAGIGDTIDVCNTVVSEDLSTHLNGVPDAGGTWQYPNFTNVGSSTIDATSDPQGFYYYIVSAAAPCPIDTAIINVRITASPDAGTDSILTLCDGGNPVDLDTILNPPTNGTWKDQGLITMGSTVIDPANAGVAGDYIHIVLAGPGCIDDTATATISIVNGPNPGLDATHSICSNTGAFDLFPLLGGTPDAGGKWYTADTTYRGAGGNMFDPANVADTAGVYYYVVAGTAPCDSAFSSLTITISSETNAGIDSLVYDCRNGDTLNLLQNLGGTPDQNGTWTAPDGSPFIGNTIDVTVADTGNYVYTVPANGTCAAGQATLRVVINDTAYAGEDNSVAYCDNALSSIHLTRQLLNDPDSTGDVRWFNPSNVTLGSGVHTTLMTAATDGVYTYVVVGQSGCNDDTALLTMNIDTFYSAGSNGNATLCRLDSMLGLFPILTNNPDSNGTWFDSSWVALGNDSLSILTADSGNYYYVQDNGNACLDDTSSVLVTITAPVSAGLDSVDVICETQASIDLSTYLHDTFDAGGVWQESGLNVSSTVIINSASIGNRSYDYIVSGTGGCPSDTSTMQIRIDSTVFAGGDVVSSLCGSATVVDLMTIPTGSIDTFGFWLDPNNDTVPANTIQLDTADAGRYTYIIINNGSCLNDTSIFDLAIGSKANAGRDSSMLLCQLDSVFRLHNELGGTPEDSGLWYLSNNALFASWDTIVNALSVDSGMYTYIVQGQSGCDDDTAQLHLDIHTPVFAGNPSDIGRCETDTVSLYTYLTGIYTEGYWEDPNSDIVFEDSLKLDTALVGNYYHIVPGSGLCPNDTASLLVSIGIPGNSGLNDSLDFCDSSSIGQLVSLLGGSPDDSGLWYFNSIQYASWDTSVNSVASGDYMYITNGSYGCPDDTASLNLQIHAVPQAGNDFGGKFCGTNVINLNDFLLGSFDSNGDWFNPSGFQVIGDSLAGDSLVTDSIYNYLYVVEGTGGCANDTSIHPFQISDGVDAGVSSAKAFCSSEDTIDLFLCLGAYDTIGVWQFGGSSLATPESFDVVSSTQSGSYYHILTGNFGCADDTATIDIRIEDAVDAGRDTNILTCSIDDSILAISWIENGISTAGLFDGNINLNGAPSYYYPSTIQNDTLLYILNGAAPCPNDTAAFTITTSIFYEAGNDTQINVCDNSQTTVLQLNNSDNTGNWTYNNSIVSNILTVADYSPQPGGHHFVYIAENDPSCPNDTAILTMHVGTYFAQTTLSDYKFCEDDGNSTHLWLDEIEVFGLFNDGVYTRNDGSLLPSPLIEHDTAFIDTFHYVVRGDSGCPAIDYLIAYEVEAEVDLGRATLDTLCLLDSAFNLVDYLQGSTDSTRPDTVGTWYIGSSPINGEFNPVLAGNVSRQSFTYEHTSQVCGSSVVGLTLLFDESGDPGLSDSITVCNSDSALNLLNVLGGQPDTNGLWYFGSLPVDAEFDPQMQPQGNYQYRILNDDNYCEPRYSNVKVTILEAPVVSFDMDLDKGCVPHSVQFTTSGNYPSGSSYLWDFGNGNTSSDLSPSVEVYDSVGSFDVSLRVITAACPNTQMIVQNAVEVFGLPSADFTTAFTEANLDQATFEFENTSDPYSNTNSYCWYFGEGDTLCSDDFIVNHAYSDTGQFLAQLFVTDTNNCFDSTSMHIGVKPIFKIYFANAFTPNEDAVNDGFKPIFHPSSIAEYDYTVFNRWGEIVFQTTDIFEYWDGTWLNQGAGFECAAGMYTYVVRVRDFKGELRDPFKGGFVLIR